MDGAFTANINEIQWLYLSHRPRGLEAVADFNKFVEKRSKMVVTATWVRPRRSSGPPSQYKAPFI